MLTNKLYKTTVDKKHRVSLFVKKQNTVEAKEALEVFGDVSISFPDEGTAIITLDYERYTDLIQIQKVVTQYQTY